MKKRIMAIYTVNREADIGSIMTALIVMDTTFKRKHPVITKYFNPQWIAQSRKHLVDHQVARITPNHMEYDIQEMLEVQYGNLLNSQKDFWKNTEIYLKDDSIVPKISHTLLKNHPDLKPNIKYEKKAYALIVAEQYANAYLFKESKEIKKIYGDFGEGVRGDKKTEEFIKDNPNNIWIRKVR